MYDLYLDSLDIINRFLIHIPFHGKQHHIDFYFNTGYVNQHNFPKIHPSYV